MARDIPACLLPEGGLGESFVRFEQLGAKKLEKFMTMIYINHRGSGRAEIANDYSLGRLVKDMDHVREKLHIDKMYLIECSPLFKPVCCASL